MRPTGRKEIVIDSMYQNKTREVFPTTEVSVNNVPELRVKNWNEIFLADTELRVVGIFEREKPNGDKETFYRLEIRQFGVKDKDVDEMTPEEIIKKIEEKQE